MPNIARCFVVFVSLVLAGCQQPVISDSSDSAAQVLSSVDVKGAEIEPAGVGTMAAQRCRIYQMQAVVRLIERCDGDDCRFEEVMYACE